MKEIKSNLFALIAKLFSVNVEEINENQRPGDISGWDSIGQLQLILKIEQAFNISLSVDDVMSMNNIGNIITLLSKNEVSQVIEKNQEVTVHAPSTFYPIRIPKNIFWGIGSLSELHNIIEIKNVAIVTSSSLYANTLYEKVKKVFKSNTNIIRLIKQSGEPKSDEIVKISYELSKYSPDLIVAIGGGSIIDAVKLAWVLFENPKTSINNIEQEINNINLRKKAKFAAIPTTFGSGSEVSSAAAYTKNTETNKTIVVSHELLPDFVFLDPRSGNDMPKTVLFASAIDALTHAIEGYVSIIENSFVEPLAVLAIKNILGSLKDIVTNDVNEDNMTKLAYSSFWAGIVQNHCSVGATHSFAHQLSNNGFNHGSANALFIIPVIQFNSSKTNKYNNLIKEVGFDSIEKFIEEIGKVIKDGNLLSQIDIRSIESLRENIIHGAMQDITFRTNPVPLNFKDMNIIFTNAINMIS